MYYFNFTKEGYRGKLQKKSARENWVGLRVLVYVKLRYFAYSEKRVRANKLAISW